MNPNNPLEQERPIKKAIQHLEDANLHIYQSDTLSPETKIKLRELIDQAHRVLLVGWAKGKAA